MSKVNFSRLRVKDIKKLLILEEEMYWQSRKWKDLWQKEAKEKFRYFIKDYLINFPQGCFGVIGKEVILGAMFLLKTFQIKPLPYLHEFSKYFDPRGNIAYVSFFVVKDGKQKETIANELYQQAQKVAINLGCQKIAVVIYSSPLEEEIIKANNYQKLERQFRWEIYPKIKVPAWIYLKNINY